MGVDRINIVMSLQHSEFLCLIGECVNGTEKQ